MAERTFSRWILDLLYTVFPPKNNADMDPIWEMGCKLYIQISKTWFNTDTDSHNYIHNLITWPINRVIHLKNRRDLHKHEIRKKERMVRTILFSFFETLSADKERDSFSVSFMTDNNYKIFWFNCINSIFYIEELIMSYSSSYKLDSGSETPKNSNNKVENTFLQEYTHSLLDGNYDGPLYMDLSKGLFFNQNGKWLDSKLLETIFRILEPIWFIKSKRRSSKPKKNVLNTK